MSLVGYDLDRIGGPIKELYRAGKDLVLAYKTRTEVLKVAVEVEGRKADALERNAAAQERIAHAYEQHWGVVTQ